MTATAMIDLTVLNLRELLTLHAGIIDELRRKSVTRSSNNPLGDWAEHLFCRAFGWTQAPNSERDADAVDRDGLRYQIKSRRITAHNRSRQLGSLRNLPSKRFDVLAAVLFEQDYRVLRAALIPHHRVVELATRVERSNSWRFILRDSVWSLDDVRDVTAELKQAEANWSPGIGNGDHIG